MSKDYKVQWTPALREAVDNRIIEYLSQGYSQQEAEDKALLDLLEHTTFNFSDDVVVTAKAPEKKEVAVETDWDPGYTKFMSGQRYYADKNHKNYLDGLRNDMTNSIRETTDKWGHAIGSGIEIASGFTPLWWVAPAVRTGIDLSEGDYKGVALNAGLAFAAPYAVGKGIQYITPYAKSAILASKLNRLIKNTTLPLYSTRYYTKSMGLPGHVNYTLHNADGSVAGGLRVESPYSAGTRGTHIEMVHKTSGSKGGVSEDLYNIAVKDALRAGFPGVESGLDLMNPLLTKHVTSKFPHVEEMIGTPQMVKNPTTGKWEFRQTIPGRMLTGTTSKLLALEAPQGHFITNYSAPAPNTPSKTSLAFFERQPANISEAERLGIPKGDRGNLSASQQEAVRDLHHYITDGKFRLKFLYDPEKGMFYFGTKTSTTPSGLQTMLNAPEKSRTVRAWSDKEGIAWIRANLTDGALSYFPETNSTNFTAKMPKYLFLGHWGEASARSRGGFDKEIILTAPKTDAQEYIVDLLSSSNADDVLLGQQMQLTLSNTIDKNTVGTFYRQLTSTSKPGTYVSGDVSDYPLGYKAITSYAKGNSSKAISDILSGEVAPITVSSRTGLSPDSYISLLRLSLRPEWNLSFNRKAGFGKWNDSAVHNKHIYDAWQTARNGTSELKLSYIQLFNDWVAPYGGAKAYINDKGVIVHPHPFIVRQKAGGSIKNKNKGKFAKVRNYINYKNNK